LRQAIRDQLHVLAPKEYIDPAVPDIKYRN